MKSRFLTCLAVVFMSTASFAQPPETTYLGTVAVTGSADDESYGPYSIGFTFNYFGNNYTQFYINSNGQVLFGAGSLESAEASIPTAAAPNNYIAPFWDDLVVDSYGSILYKTIGASPNRKLVVQFHNMGLYPFPATLGTFSVILYETSNVIQIQYRLIVLPESERAHGSSATIGLENVTGTAGVLFASQNPSAITNEQAISFTPIAGPSYSADPNAVYDGIYLTTNLTTPEPGITDLINPPQNAVIGADYRFTWGTSAYATSYTLYLGTDPELSGATSYAAGSNNYYDISGLTLDETYYWGVFAQNSTGTTWCEIQKFSTSSTPPLAGVPLTIWVAQGSEREIKLQYTGGDASTKTATVTSLPTQGQLWQVSSGVKSTQITSVPEVVTDPAFSVIYVASGTTGNGVGNFNFKFHDDTGDSPEATITVNVSAAGIPNFLEASRNANIELQFDRTMNDPAGKQTQFSVLVNGAPATINSAALKTGDPYTIILNLATPLTGTETVFVSYTQGNVSATTGGLLASFSSQPVVRTAQTLSFLTNLSKKYGDIPFVVAASSSSGLTAFTFSSSNTAVATINVNLVTIHTIGTSDITAYQAGNATYAPARYIKTLTVSKGDQTITFATLPAKTYGAADFNLTATASSGLTVTFAGNNNAVATVTGTLVHITGGGSLAITASQAGNSLWNPAPDVPRTQTVNKVVLTATADDKSRAYGEDNPPFTISYSGFVNSENVSVIDVVPTATSTATPATNVGTVPITVSGGSDNSYSFTYVSGTLTINKADQTITFNPLADKVTGEPDFDPGATASSGLAVSYSSDNLAVATIVSNMIHIVDQGTTNITASQAGNSNYNAAMDVIQPLTVNLPTGLEKITASPNSFKIYSSFDLIHIQTLDNDWDGNIGSVRVFNIIGKPVNDLQNIEFLRDTPVQIQGPEAKGIYMVEIRSGLKRFVGKVVVR